MEFLRRSNESYVIEYTKAKAVKELKRDIRINKITKTLNSITVHTNPIIPYVVKRKLLSSPIGTYIIKIVKKGKRLYIGIKRKEGLVNGHRLYPYVTHYHIFGNNICWGNIGGEVYTICMKKDWYWAVKRSLDLLMDCKPEIRDHRYKPIMHDLLNSYKQAHSS